MMRKGKPGASEEWAGKSFIMVRSVGVDEGPERRVPQQCFSYPADPVG